MDEYTDTLTLLEAHVANIPQIPIAEHEATFYGMIFTAATMAIIAFLRLNDGDVFKQIAFGMFSYKRAFSLISNSKASLALLLLLLVSFATLSVIIGYILDGEFFTVSAAICACILTALHFTAIIFIKFSGWTFRKRNTATTAIMSLWLSNISFGLFCTPLVISLFFINPGYSRSIISAAAILAAILALLRYARWCKILFDSRVFISYIILYLCGLEVVPLLTIVKLLAR